MKSHKKKQKFIGIRSYQYLNMMKHIQFADVVIINQSHYAIALRYDDNQDNVPIVTAKGVNTIALKIINVAFDNGINIIQNPLLAGSLYRDVEKIGDPIPEALYTAVAEILAYVYSKIKRMKTKRICCHRVVINTFKYGYKIKRWIYRHNDVTSN